MEFAGQAIYFVLLVVCNLTLIVAAATFPFGVGGILLGVFTRNSSLAPRSQEFFSRIEIFVVCGAMLVVGWLLYSTPDLVTPYFRFWESPLLLGVVLFTLVLRSRGASSHNPILRDLSGGVLTQTTCILIIIAISELFVLTLWSSTQYYAICTALVIALLTNTIQFFSMPVNIRLFEQLEKRHNLLSHSLGKLRQIAFLLGDSKNWEMTQEAVVDVERLTQSALQSLNQKKFDEAEGAMIQAETEVAHTEQLIRNELRFSLREDLTAKIENALQDVEALGREFEESGLSTEGLSGLAERVEKLREQIPEPDENTDALSTRLQTFERVMREIAETRTALRFRRNIGSVIDRQTADLDAAQADVDLATALDVSVDDVIQTRGKLASDLDQLQSGSITDSSDLVRGYQDLQATVFAFQSAQARLGNTINRGWNRSDVIDSAAAALVPKICSTTSAARLVITVDFSRLDTEDCTISVDGALVELPAEREIKLTATEGKSDALEYLEFAGKRGGRGSISIRVKTGDKEERMSIPVQIVPSLNDTIQNSVFTAGIGAGLTGIGLWYFTGDVSQAGVIGAAVGAVLSIVPFVLKKVRYRGVPV